LDIRMTNKKFAKILRIYGEHSTNNSNKCDVPCYDRGQKTHDQCNCGLTKIIEELEKGI